MRVADYLFRTLADLGVKDVFMVSGGGAMFLNDALGSEKRIRTVCTHHEQGAAVAAEGYARTSGAFSVVSVTTGPGGTNAITGLIGEWLDSIPVLFLSGQVKFSTTVASRPDIPLRQLGDQEINIVDLVRPVTKYAAMVVDPKSIRRELEKALFIMNSGRKGPVWLDLPLNVQSTEIEPSELEGFVPPSVPEYPELPARTETLFRKFLCAKSPVLVAGHGIRLAGAEGVFEKLVNRLKVPVVSTFEGFDLIPSDSPYFAGRIGTIGTRSGNLALQNADFVLALGTRNNIRQASYNYENFARGAETVAVVDIDPAELRKNTVRITDPVCADVRDFLKAFLLLAERKETPSFRHWLDWCIERRRRYPTVLPEYFRTSSGVNPYVFTEILTEFLPESSAVACTNATPSLALFQAGVVKRGQRMFCNSGCAAMGFGLPAAMGAAAAAAGKTIVCLEGDGSLMMNLQELQTVRHHKFPVHLFLYNNNEYCSIRQTQDNFFEGRHTGCDNGSGVTFPEWEKIASAFGWRYERISSADEAKRKLPGILAVKEPVFCDVVLSPGYRFAPKLSSRKLPDGSLVSPSLEDMFPFLPEEEMRSNRYIPPC